MNFTISVPGKLHCILEKVTNKFPGQSLEERFSLRKFMMMANGAIRPNHSQDFANTTTYKCLEYFELFRPRTWTSQSFLLMC